MYTIRAMSIEDYDLVMRLLEQIDGVRLRDADSRDSVSRYLDRNPGLSFVAEAGGELVGCLMCGHDGKRGYLQHLAVSASCRGRGIAKALVRHCIDELQRVGIAKSHLDVLRNNAIGKAFWESQGWTLRTDIDRYSYISAGGENV